VGVDELQIVGLEEVGHVPVVQQRRHILQQRVPSTCPQPDAQPGCGGPGSNVLNILNLNLNKQLIVKIFLFQFWILFLS